MLRKWFGFCLFGHIFPTSSHPNVPPRSKEAIQQALNVPILFMLLVVLMNIHFKRCHLDLKVYVPYHILTMLH